MSGAQPAICPHCGYDLEAEGPVIDGDFEYRAGWGVGYQGRRLRMQPAAHQIVGALMRSPGNIIKKIALADRIGYEGEQPDKLVHVHLTRARNAFREAGAPDNIRTFWGQGVAWESHNAPAPQ